MRYYPISPQTRDVVEQCCKSWVRERLGERERYRPVGCGERRLCPVCGTYQQDVLAREAAELVLLVQEAVEIWARVRSESYGLKVVLTVPKALSAEIDAVRGEEWWKKVNELYRAGGWVVKRVFGDGVAWVAGMDLSGESAPWEPHYHLNYYILPVAREGGKWRALRRWSEVEALVELRRMWAEEVGRIWGREVGEVVVHVGYLRGAVQVRHWLRYLYRHPLEDLWKGWLGFGGGELRYRYRKGGREKRVKVSGEEAITALGRVVEMPSKFKRIRWGGWLADGVRRKVLEGLALVREEEEEEGGGWERVGTYRLVAFTDTGVVLEDTERGGWVEVGDEEIDYRPWGVATGKRVRWREPGPKRGGRGGWPPWGRGGLRPGATTVVKPPDTRVIPR